MHMTCAGPAILGRSSPQNSEYGFSLRTVLGVSGGGRRRRGGRLMALRLNAWSPPHSTLVAAKAPDNISRPAANPDPLVLTGTGITGLVTNTYLYCCGQMIPVKVKPCL
jgi:hypothetical protein